MVGRVDCLELDDLSSHWKARTLDLSPILFQPEPFKGDTLARTSSQDHGISKALTYFEPDLRGPLKAEGFLTRDSRTVERKKYGRAKARRSFQFSKR